ncbi:MAG: mechanosensitive ion channel family protein, partial [Arenicellales bacterium]
MKFGHTVKAILLILALQGVSPMLEAAETETVSQTKAIPDRLAKDEVDDLVARLSDQEVRALLISQLDKVAMEKPESSETSVLDQVLQGMARFKVEFQAAINALDQVPGTIAAVWRRISEGHPDSTFSVLIKIIVFFGFGVLAEWLFRKKSIKMDGVREPDTLLPLQVRLKLCVSRLIFEMLCVVFFMLGAAGAWFVIGLPTDYARYIYTSLFGGVVLLKLINAASKLFFAPRMAHAQLIPIEDDVARALYKKVLIVAAAIIFLIWWVRETLNHFEVEQAVSEATILLTSAIAVGIMIATVWFALPVNQGNQGDQGDRVDNKSSRLELDWRVLIISGVLLFYLLAIGLGLATGADTLSPFVLSLVVVGLAAVADLGLRASAQQLTDRSDSNDTDQSPAASLPEIELDRHMSPEQSDVSETTDQESLSDDQSYASVLITNGRILLFIVVLFGIAEIWNLNLIGLLSEIVGERTTKVMVNFLVTALFAYALWGIVNTAVSRLAGPEPGPGISGGEPGGGGGSRIGTLLPLMRKFLFITLSVVLVLILLSSMGVNIGPLIAGAGIFGIAIGFGAQTLVKDIVSGLFFLLDDAFRVGEYVTIGSTKGTVEKISVRSLRLRHHNGPLHTVPFGEIQTLTNWSRDYAIMKFEIRVPFETDVDMIRKLIKKVGEAMLDDPELGPQFLDPLKSQGANRMDDSAFIVRCKFTCKPGNQFLLRREAYARIQAAFEENGIRFAPRRVVVETIAPPNSTEAAAAATAAA